MLPPSLSYREVSHHLLLLSSQAFFLSLQPPPNGFVLGAAADAEAKIESRPRASKRVSAKAIASDNK